MVDDDAVGNTDVSPTDDDATGDSCVKLGVAVDDVLAELDKDDTDSDEVCSKFFTFTDNL